MDFHGLDAVDESPKPRFRPCIAELMRTMYCAPSIVLLVMRIKIVDVQTPKGLLQAYRLWLGDGEKCIQGILKKEMHRFVITEETTVGSYVMLDKYDLCIEKRLNGRGEVAYLAIQDFHTIGQEQRMKGSVGGEEVKSRGDNNELKEGDEEDVVEGDQDTNAKRSLSEDSVDLEDHSSKRVKLQHDSLSDLSQSSRTTNHSNSDGRHQRSTRQRRNSSDIFRSLSTEEKENQLLPEASARDRCPIVDSQSRGKDTADPLPISFSRSLSDSTGTRDRYATNLYNPYHDTLNQEPVLPYAANIAANYPRPPPVTKPFAAAQSPKLSKPRSLTQPAPTSALLNAAPTSANTRPTTAKSVTRSLTLYPLSSLPSLPKQQGFLLDVLAIIDSVSPSTVKRPNMPLKRDVRVVDPSTSKRVALSVFTGAEMFVPEVGTVALIRNVRNHRWDGGSLNAYPGDCEGWNWFVKDPVKGEGWDGEKLKRWWVEEQERRAKEELESEVNEQGEAVKGAK